MPVLLDFKKTLTLIIAFILLRKCTSFKIKNMQVHNYPLYDGLKNPRHNSKDLYTKTFEPSTETIYGLSSGIPEGGCGVAVVRVSGPDSLYILSLLTKKNADKELFKPRQARFCKIFSLIDKDVIDNVLTIYFKSPYSYTGDDTVEFHTHGSRSVILELFDNFRHIANSYNVKLRQAEKGEFTRRAYYSGKFNLTQVEGIRELISSDNYIRKKNSMLKIDNSLYKLYNKWMNDLIVVIGLVEASIDFQEEISNEITLRDPTKIQNLLSNLLTDINSYINNKKEIIIEGIKLLLIGPPNSGKSSFINNLLDQDISIVSQYPGTTRDLIRANYKINDLNFQIIDSAGLRTIPSKLVKYNKLFTINSDDNAKIEQIGINKVLKELQNVNVILFLFDPLNLKDSIYSLDSLFSNLSNLEESLKESENVDPLDKLLYVCISKEDLVEDINSYKENVKQHLSKLAKTYMKNPKILNLLENTKVYPVSNMDKKSIKEVVSQVNKDVKKHFNLTDNVIFINDQRHKSHLNNVTQFIKSVLELIDKKSFDLEVIAEHLRECTYEIEFITGERTDDYVLNNIFNTFCVGK